MAVQGWSLVANGIVLCYCLSIDGFSLVIKGRSFHCFIIMYSYFSILLFEGCQYKADSLFLLN